MQMISKVVRAEEEACPSESTATPDADSASAAASEETPSAMASVPLSTSPIAGSVFHVPVVRNDWLMPQPPPPPQESGLAACSAIPHDAQGRPTSIGSLGHAQGLCKPCVFAHHASKSCLNGIACSFCHFEHAPKQKRRLTNRNGRQSA